MPLTILLNGQSKLLDLQHATVAELVSELGFSSDRVAVEHNGVIVSRAHWKNVDLAEGDKVELVQFVGGGAPVN